MKLEGDRGRSSKVGEGTGWYRSVVQVWCSYRGRQVQDGGPLESGGGTRRRYGVPASGRSRGAVTKVCKLGSRELG